MNAIRKATEHRRKPRRTIVSAAGLRVLNWLTAFGGVEMRDGEYRQAFGAVIDDAVVECETTLPTIEALERRGLVTIGEPSAGHRAVDITEAGRQFLKGRSDG